MVGCALLAPSFEYPRRPSTDWFVETRRAARGDRHFSKGGACIVPSRVPHSEVRRFMDSVRFEETVSRGAYPRRLIRSGV